MSSTNGQHPNKPKGVLCRRGALIKWTGWSETCVDYLVRSKKLQTKTFRKGGKLYYYVESAEKILNV